MATSKFQRTKASEGTLFWHEDLIKAYKTALGFAGDKGKVATMPEIITAKANASENDPIWTQYLTTTSGEFYGISKGGVPIVVVAHGIDEILQNEEIMKRSTKDMRENSNIQLTTEEFRKLEGGAYGPTHIIELSTVLGMRKYPSSVLSYGEACDEDPLLLARLGTDAKNLYEGSDALRFLKKHKEITMKESGNYFILTNNHNYPYRPKENNGGLLVISQLCNMMRCGGEPSSVSSEINVSDLNSAARFVAMNGKGNLGNVNNKLALTLRNLAANWSKVSVPYSGEIPSLFTLEKNGREWFTMYPKNGDGMDTGIPQFHVKSLREIRGAKSFTTTIGGYHGFLKYDVDEVRAVAPQGANAYSLGDTEIVWEGGNPQKHRVSVQFYRAKVDVTRRILKEEEIMADGNLVRKLLSR